LNEHKIILSKRVAQNDKLETINELVMYPNLAKDIVNIDCSNARQMIIIDVMGKTIKQWNNTAQYQTLTPSSLLKVFI